ncbi:prenyltransferase [Streptomyces fuscigenes]|uniref:prenyltransferase n=1 Tax=Streptomyces fuscigenes TaxID=1528880 RepID=UPI001F196FF2|nr:prenyltransferase [Streptomyces fuscigenes]MCF3963730.1 prenyltransferase [Streptomyces fuscigenes]
METGGNTALERETPLGVRAARLVASVEQDGWGSVRPSLYETARVVSYAPWLEGDARRVTYLLDEQAPDGSWGEGGETYRLVPTLSAVEALLSVARRPSLPAATAERAVAAVARGLAALHALPEAGPWPDTAAAEILVPALVAAVNDHLSGGEFEGHDALGPWRRGAGLPVPGGYHGAAPSHVARKYGAVGDLPVKFHHTFEGLALLLPDALVPRDHEERGLLGSSPAATAAWAARRTPGPPPYGGGVPGAEVLSSAAVRELREAGRRYGGLFPEAAPIVVFERLWVAAALSTAGLLDEAGARTARRWVERIYDTSGVRGAPGLMIDADDTAMAVLVAARLGLPLGPEPLALFHNGTHYDCYLGEDTGSVTANAHALRALGASARRDPGLRITRAAELAGQVEWLTGAQHADGYWPDKWHASPYYATERTVTALARHGGDRAAGALARAVEWTRDAQRPDGTWGVWGGTAEETAYAVKILLGAPGGHEHALKRAEAALDAMCAPGSDYRHPPLWHDKTLYAPLAMIEAEVLGARHLLRGRHG